MDQRMDRRTLAKGAGALAGTAAMGMLPTVAEAGQRRRRRRRNRASTTDWVGTSRSLRSSTGSATRSSPTRNSTRTPPSRRGTRPKPKARLPGLKFGRTLWIAAVAGGPFEYTGLPLEEAHAELHLTADEFAEVGAEIVRALDFYEVPEREQQELVEAYQASMSDVVTATTS